jgi:NAD(P)H-hydrate epimerase
MLSEDSGAFIRRMPDALDKYDAIAVGPGLGRNPETKEALLALLGAAKEARLPVLIDADALNLLSEVPLWKDYLSEYTVLTPHLGELRRLMAGNEPDRFARELCSDCGCTLVLKGFHTKVYIPGQDCLVNTTGNPGLAKGGSGDVLTGLAGGLLARGYAPADAAALGVWLHGFAGDCLTRARTAEAWSSRDLVDSLYLGFNELYGNS